MSQDEVISEIESVLFSTGRRMSPDELAGITHHPIKAIKGALAALKARYEKKQGSLTLIEDNGAFKLTVKDKYMSVVSKVVSRTELTAPVLETLAIIAFKYPILQSDVIKIRTSKAYEHLAELEDSGYIQRERHGRTKKIRLSPKFFEYFDIPEEKMKEAFARFEAVEETITEQERKIQQKEAEQRAELESAGQRNTEGRETIGPLETYDAAADDVGTDPEAIGDEELEVEVVKEKSKRGDRKELEDALNRLQEDRAQQTDPEAEALDIENALLENADDASREEGDDGRDDASREDGDDGRDDASREGGDDGRDDASREGGDDEEPEERVGTREMHRTAPSQDPFFNRRADDSKDEMDDESRPDELFGNPDLDDESIKSKEKETDELLEEIYQDIEKNKDELTGKINKGNLKPT